MPKTHLKRSIGLISLTFYGLGTILGAGIYVLIGKITGIAGAFSPFAFLLAAIIALSCAFSYAELSALFPKSAGEAVYVDRAFRSKWLTKLVGWGIVLTGIVSAATLTSGFIGYALVFIELPVWIGKILILLILGSITATGIKLSVATAMIITIIETAGLCWVIAVNADTTVAGLSTWVIQLSSFSASNNLSPILLGSFIAFYAFIGFEDIVNIAEEVKNPKRNLPLAIFLSLIIATLLYFGISLTSVTVLPIGALSNSEAPIAALVAGKSITAVQLISLIGMIAIINGALVQIIMSSRVIYGMSTMNSAHKIFSYLQPNTQTPTISITLVTILIGIFSLWLPLVTLAKLTSFLILIIFLLVNLSLIILKIDYSSNSPPIKLPIWLPVLASTFCLLLLLSQLFTH